jgi:hypothetical protein
MLNLMQVSKREEIKTLFLYNITQIYGAAMLIKKKNKTRKRRQSNKT